MITNPGRRACLAALALATPAWATGPAAGTRLVVAGAPFSLADDFARLFADTTAPLLGESIAIQHRLGARGAKAEEEVVRAAPDGHALLVAGSAAITAAPHLHRQAQDPLQRLVPVAMLGAGPFVLLVHPGVPAGDVRDLQALMVERPDEVTFGSGGNGSPAHLCAEQLAAAMRVRLTHVAYRSDVRALQDLVAGHVRALFVAPPGLAMRSIAARRVRALAVTSRARLPTLPDVPTIDEAVHRGFEALHWVALFAPRGTPTPRIRALGVAWQEARARPAVAARLQALGMRTPDEIGAGEPLRAFIEAESQRQGRLIRQLGLQAD